MNKELLDFVSSISAQRIINVCKFNKDSWEADFIEVATSLEKPFLIFDLNLIPSATNHIDACKIDCIIEEIWTMDEKGEPDTIGCHHLHDWHRGAKVIVQFEPDLEQGTLEIIPAVFK